MWNQFSRRYTDVVLPEFRPFGRRLIELAGIRPGMWVLDVATGPGEPALTIARRALERHDAFHPPPGAPDFFRFGKSGAVERALRAAGFRQVRTERMTVEWVFNNSKEFWGSMKEGPSLRRALAKVSPAIRRAVRADVFRALAQYERNGRLRIPNEAVLALGVK